MVTKVFYGASPKYILYSPLQPPPTPFDALRNRPDISGSNIGLDTDVLLACCVSPASHKGVLLGGYVGGDLYTVADARCPSVSPGQLTIGPG